MGLDDLQRRRLVNIALSEDDDIKGQLLKLAQSDLRRAKKQGYILISQTQKGTLALRYSDSEYQLWTQGTSAKQIAKGDAKVVAAALADLYSVES